MASWATTADVLDVTGKTVTAEIVRRANYQIEDITGRVAVDEGRTKTSPPTTAKDAEWLRRAVAYQAVWMAAQPDDLTRLDLVSTGTQASAVEFTETALVLATHAKQALMRLSWMRSRTIGVRNATSYRGDQVDADGFRNGKWVPL